MKITKSQLKQIIKEELEKVDLEKESDSWDLKPEEGIDAVEHAIETMGALKDLISDMMDDKQELNEALDPALLTPENFETLIQAVKHGVTQKEVLFTIIGASGWQLLKQLGIVPKMSEDEAALAPEDEV